MLMRAVACLLAVLFLAAAGSAVAQEKHLIDPMLPGSLNPKPLPPLKNQTLSATSRHGGYRPRYLGGTTSTPRKPFSSTSRLSAPDRFIRSRASVKYAKRPEFPLGTAIPAKFT